LGPEAGVESYIQSLPVAEGIMQRVFEVPWFKHDRPEIVAEHAEAYKKVVAGHEALLADDPGDPPEIGGYSSFFTDRRDKK
jgi:hypothetical protein